MRLTAPIAVSDSMETLPMPLGDAAPGALDEFRISSSVEIQSMLKQLCDLSLIHI